MEEIFYEDILDTFLFCFIASAGLIQIMIARRGWHGLSFYGGRVRPAVNYVLGTALVIFAYALYFSDPLHRNVRNIEAFMSLVCLVLGIAAASAATALLASAVESLRRRFGRGRRGRTETPPSVLERIVLPGGAALLSAAWGGRGDNLVVLAEPGRGSESLARSLFASLPEGRGMLSLHPRHIFPDHDSGAAAAVGQGVMDLLDQVRKERGVDLRGESFLGLGWGGNALSRLVPQVRGEFEPRRLVALAPVVPDCARGFAGDALLSDTPSDILSMLAANAPWKDRSFTRLLRSWLPVLAVCVVAATAVTVGFDVRWKLFSGPAAGLLLSLWVTYFLVKWRGDVGGGGWEAGTVSRLCSPDAGYDALPLTVVLVADSAGGAAAPTRGGPETGPDHLGSWEDVLRGKLILDDGTLDRLAALIWG